MAMKKPCAKCGKTFDAYSRATKLCDKCWEKASKHSNRRANKKFKTKENFDSKKPNRIKENKKHPYKRSRK